MLLFIQMGKTQNPKIKTNIGEDIEEISPPIQRDKDGSLSTKVAHRFKYQGSKYSLSSAQKRFADYYVASNGDKVSASRFAGYKGKKPKRRARNWLKLDSVSAYINKKLVDYGFNDHNITKQHLFLINQHEDLTNKAKGVDMYYKIRGSYAPEQHEHRIEKVEVVDYSKINTQEAQEVKDE